MFAEVIKSAIIFIEKGFFITMIMTEIEYPDGVMTVTFFALFNISTITLFYCALDLSSPHRLGLQFSYPQM